MKKILLIILVTLFPVFGFSDVYMTAGYLETKWVSHLNNYLFTFKGKQYDVRYEDKYKIIDYVVYKNLCIIDVDKKDTTTLVCESTKEPITFFATKDQAEKFNFLSFTTRMIYLGFELIYPKIDEELNLVTIYYVTSQPKIKPEYIGYEKSNIPFYYDYLLIRRFIVIDMDRLVIIKTGTIGEPVLFQDLGK